MTDTITAKLENPLPLLGKLQKQLHTAGPTLENVQSPTRENKKLGLKKRLKKLRKDRLFHPPFPAIAAKDSQNLGKLLIIWRFPKFCRADLRMMAGPGPTLASKRAAARSDDRNNLSSSSWSAILHRLGHMAGSQHVRAVQIGNGAGDPQGAVHGPA